ncbi:MAG: AAA domain-containing protein, partial [Bacteroidaceae bacterium]
YQGLHSFAIANKDRRDLLLSQRLPDFDPSFEQRIKEATNDFERIALKAEAAKDYFLLVGPPGTGKTSHALKRMVETFYAQPQTQLLLLAYTNRAVDEICKSLSTIYPKVDYIRVGSELSCDEVFRSHLIENELSSCLNRSQVYARISKCRVFVGTVASISNKPELFRLKSFSAAIVDEATQILEPQLLGILCAKDNQGNNAVGKFILIGDHKQLPAVVLQSKEQSCVQNEFLNKMGLLNLRDSLFERLYRTNTDTEQSKVVDMLCKQGRMNPEVALFPNNAFYGGKLEIVGLPHQLELWDDVPPEGDFLDRLMNKRIAFIPSEAEKTGGYGKTNSYEAKMAAKLAMKVYERYRKDFDTTKTLGIITPYRSQ